MAEHHRSRPEDRPAERRPPVGPGGVDRDLGDDHIDHAVEEVLLAADMGVQRHRLDAQLLAELAHADRVDALPIGEGDGGRQDARAGQRRPSFLALVPRLDAVQSSLLTSLRRTDYLTPYGRKPYAVRTPERTTREGE